MSLFIRKKLWFLAVEMFKVVKGLEDLFRDLFRTEQIIVENRTIIV